MPKSNIVKYTVEFDALEELSDDFVKRIIYEFFRSKAISVTRSGLTKRAADLPKAEKKSQTIAEASDYVPPINLKGASR